MEFFSPFFRHPEQHSSHNLRCFALLAWFLLLDAVFFLAFVCLSLSRVGSLAVLLLLLLLAERLAVNKIADEVE